MHDAIQEIIEDNKAFKNKAWRNQYYATNRERINARKRAWRAANPDRVRKALKLYAERHPEKWKSQRRAYYEKNKDTDKGKRWRITKAKYNKRKRQEATEEEREIRRANARVRYWKRREQELARQKEYRARNREHTKSRQREWYQNNTHKAKATIAKYSKENPEQIRKLRDCRRARLLNASIGNTSVIAAWQKSWRKKRRVTCYWCRCTLPGWKAHADHIDPLSKGGSHAIENLCISCATCNLRKNAATPGEWSSCLEQPTLF